MSSATYPEGSAPFARRAARSLSMRLSAIPAWRLQSTVAFLVFFSMGLGIMWPAPLHPGSSVFGPLGADLTGEISYYRVLAADHVAPFLPGIVHSFNAPEGRPTQWALNFSQLPSSFVLWVSSMAIGAIATFTFWPVFTFALSALSMFLFVRWVTGRWEAGFVAGLAWGFQPFVFSGQNQPLGDVFVIVLFVWRMFVAIERPTARNGLWMGLACVLALLWVQYFLIIVGVAWAVLAIYALVFSWSRGELRRAVISQVVGAVPILTGMAAVLLAGIVSGFSGVPTRSVSDLTTFSARPSMYLYPDPNNPFTGSLTRGYVNRHFNSATLEYNEIYVGISVIVLAAAGLWLAGRFVRRRGLSNALEDRRILVAVGLTLLGIVGFFFSMPPHADIFGVAVPMPMDIIARFTTVFRTVARFEVLVMLGLCALLAFSLSEILPRLRRAPVRLIVVVVIGFVVTADLWARAPVGITRVHPPHIYRVLARQPKGIYAEYPILPGADFGGISYKAFWQGYAGDHDLFDGFFAGAAQEAPKMALEDLLDPTTERTLAGYGVKYILVDVAELGETPQPYPRQGQAIPGAKLIGRDGYGSLYRVTAQPPRLSVDLSNGFSSQESSSPTDRWQWMASSTAAIAVTSRYRHPVRVRVSFRARAFGPTRRVWVLDPSGHVVDKTSVSATAGLVRFTATVAGTETFRISTVPGAIPVQTLDPGNPDTRSLAIQALLPVESERLR